MSFKIPCGGFMLGEGLVLSEDGKTLNVSGGGGGGVQPDWNQNDSTATDYIKNRPFYEGDPVETVLVEESTVSFSGSGGMYLAQIQSNFEATVGETYKVTWDGTVYESTCVDSGGIVIGNLSIIGEGSDTGEPFVIIPKKAGLVIHTADTSASHTFSISGNQTPIVKIPAKYIDKNSSGYIVIHSNATMTKQEAQNYKSAISKGEAVFIIWGELCIKSIGFGSSNGVYFMSLKTLNGESYSIAQNGDGLFKLGDRRLSQAYFPVYKTTEEENPNIRIKNNQLNIVPSTSSDGVGSTNVLFQVEPDGTKSKAFEVLGNGEAVAPALILYSSTAGSTKKFRITVDDSGTLKATEI